MASGNPFSTSGGGWQGSQGSQGPSGIPGGSMRERYNQNRRPQGQRSPYSGSSMQGQQSSYGAMPPSGQSMMGANRIQQQKGPLQESSQGPQSFMQPQHRIQQLNPQPQMNQQSRPYVPPQWQQAQRPSLSQLQQQYQRRYMGNNNFDPGPPMHTADYVSPEVQAQRAAETRDYFARHPQGAFQPQPSFMMDDGYDRPEVPNWGMQGFSRRRG